MRIDAQTPVVRLADYRPPDWLVERVDLVFRLDPAATRVRARLVVRPNPARVGQGPLDFRLDGEGLTFVAAEIDGRPLPADAIDRDAQSLTVPAQLAPQDGFVWTCETELAPQDNTALEGLYMSKGMYCTQCEAQGFRRITWFPDRPDVMAEFRVRVEGDAPVLLSNGNLVVEGPGWAEWHDPFPKPSYLFALVAGDLRAVEDRFVTASGRDVLLQIWVRPGDEDRCGYAMDALKRSMRWDETEYGREYDLDRFMIVAVDDFNMGAMENKGLNIFNSKFVLASPATATDADYVSIEAIIAHEYFHNWTGNRITCRDWFQLCLKEGLTVFRDQQFSGDMRDSDVRRIEDVIRLRAAQFREDAGPLAHPVRPSEYIEINNFYTATVYEKGAEVIRMLRGLVGPEAWRRALDLYFTRHDGQACTVEDWLAVFEDATGRDLSQFALWYSQAGTPQIEATEAWERGRYTLRLTQKTPPTLGEPEKAPLVVPVAYGLLAPDGTEIEAGVIELTGPEAVLRRDLAERPVASLLRGFSAPASLRREIAPADRALLIAHDGDAFNRWEGARAYGLDLLARMTAAPEDDVDGAYLAAIATAATDADASPAFRALLLAPPSDGDVIAHIAEQGRAPDPVAAHAAGRRLERAVAAALGPALSQLYTGNDVPGPYRPDAADTGRRALRNRALALITALDPAAAAAQAQFDAADNMTDRMAALNLLIRASRGEDALARFHADWRDDRLVLDKWFAVQAAATSPERAVETVADLAAHPDFDWRNPNRFRALIATFAMANPAGLHRGDGAGYALVTDWLIRLDPVNPQTAARVATAFGNWRIFDEGRRARLHGELVRLAGQPSLSKDMSEIIGRILQGPDA